MDIAVQVENVSHRYGSRCALDGVSLEVPSGTIFGLLGPNGSGKSTLFRILTTQMRASEGSARVAGADVSNDADDVRRRIGVVFQHPSLDDKLRVDENLRHHGHLFGLGGSVLEERIGHNLDRFGLAARSRDRVGTLSGGLARRAELAKALLTEPSVLILDEPSTGLDPGARASLMSALRDVRESDGTTCLLTTHLMEEADGCDRIAILDHGKVVACDSPDVLRGSIGGDVVTMTTSDSDSLATRVRERFGLEASVSAGLVSVTRGEGHTFVPDLVEAFPGEIDSITVGKPTLGDVFLSLTGHRMDEGNAEAESAADSGKGRTR